MIDEPKDGDARLRLLIRRWNGNGETVPAVGLPVADGRLSAGDRLYGVDEAWDPEQSPGANAIAASVADAAVIIADSERRLSTSVRSLAYLFARMGVPSIFLAIDAEDPAVLADLSAQARSILSPLGLSGVTVGPLLSSVTGSQPEEPSVMRWLENCRVRQPFAGSSDADATGPADHFAANVFWLSDEPLYPERLYSARIGDRLLTAHVTEIKHRFDPDSLERLAARDLRRYEFAYVNIAFDAAIALDRKSENSPDGSFLLVDRATGETAGGGSLEFALWRSSTVSWHETAVDKAARSARTGHRPALIWLTGLSGSGKSTVANALEKRLNAEGCQTYLLDGDNLRLGLNRDLGFLPEDRVENIRRVGEVARLFVDSGTIVLAALISPFRSEREMVRNMVDPDEFIEIFVDTPLEECERRDPKGLYRRARAGEIRNFTGVDSPYEAPDNAEIVLHTVGHAPEDLADRIYAYMGRRGLI